MAPTGARQHRSRSAHWRRRDRSHGYRGDAGKASLTRWRWMLVRKYRNTPRSQAESLARLGRAYEELASEHRGFARGVAPVVNNSKSSDDSSQFAEWISTLVILAAEAERLLALEVELARKFGLTWQQVGDALGVSRQAACDRFNTHERWNKSRRISQLSQARWAAGYRLLRQDPNFSEENLAPFHRLRQNRITDRTRDGA